MNNNLYERYTLEGIKKHYVQKRKIESIQIPISTAFPYATPNGKKPNKNRVGFQFENRIESEPQFDTSFSTILTEVAGFAFFCYCAYIILLTF